MKTPVSDLRKFPAFLPQHKRVKYYYASKDFSIVFFQSQRYLCDLFVLLLYKHLSCRNTAKIKKMRNLSERKTFSTMFLLLFVRTMLRKIPKRTLALYQIGLWTGIAVSAQT